MMQHDNNDGDDDGQWQKKTQQWQKKDTTIKQYMGERG